MRLGQGHCGRVTVLPTGDGTLQSLCLVTRNFCLMAGFPQRPRRLALCLLPVQSTDSGHTGPMSGGGSVSSAQEGRLLSGE